MPVLGKEADEEKVLASANTFNEVEEFDKSLMKIRKK